MKSKKIVTFLSGLAFTLFLACSGGGSKKQTAIVKPDKLEISGDLSDYLQVVDGEYEIVDDFGGKVSIKVKAIKELPLEKQDKGIKITASILDKNSMPVSGTGEFIMKESSSEKIRLLLKNGIGEEIIELAAGSGSQYDDSKHASKSKMIFVSGYFTNSGNGDLVITKSDYLPGVYYAAAQRVFFHNSPIEETRRNAFILKGEPIDVTKVENGFGYTVFTSTENKTSSGWLKMSELTQSGDISNQENTIMDNQGLEDAPVVKNGDCDEFLKDYEAFVNSYIMLIKKYKANPSDITILEEYNEAAQKAIEMENNLSICADTKYASKLLELHNKLAKQL